VLAAEAGLTGRTRPDHPTTRQPGGADGPPAHAACPQSPRRRTWRVRASDRDAARPQVWWPSTKVIAYPDHAPQPIWDDDKRTYCDPSTGLPLRTWSETIDELDQALDEAVIAYVGSRMFP
jgi:hypothetical protein